MPRPSSSRSNKAPVDPRARGVQLLARREHSSRELARKLEQRGIPKDEAEAAVAELGRDGWQSDARYAGMLVRTRIAQGFGPLRIDAELRQAGISSDGIRLAQDEAGADWRAICAEVHARRFGQRPTTGTERAKQYRYLQGRGFDSSQIGAVLTGPADSQERR